VKIVIIRETSLQCEEEIRKVANVFNQILASSKMPGTINISLAINKESALIALRDDEVLYSEKDSSEYTVISEILQYEETIQESIKNSTLDIVTTEHFISPSVHFWSNPFSSDERLDKFQKIEKFLGKYIGEEVMEQILLNVEEYVKEKYGENGGEAGEDVEPTTQIYEFTSPLIDNLENESNDSMFEDVIGKLELNETIHSLKMKMHV
jgi:hypothetical protein